MFWRSRLHVAGAVLVLFLCGNDRSIAQGAAWRPVPLTQSTPSSNPLLASPDGRRFAYPPTRGEQPLALPEDFVPQARLPLGPLRFLVMGRKAITGELMAVVQDRQSTKALHIDPRLARSLYFFHAFTAFDQSFLLAYDVEETMPSGRSATIVKDGVDLYHMAVVGDALRFEKRADKLPLSGMDAAYRDQRVGPDHLLCAQAACLVLSKEANGDMTSKELRRPEWASRSLVEMHNDGKTLRGLFRKDHDDRFNPPPDNSAIIHAECGIWPDGDCRDIPAGTLPSGFQADGKPAFVKTCADVESVLRKDLLAMPGHGLPFLGMNNHEGRIPWGQVYVLDGMLDVIERRVLPQKRFDALRDAMRQRVALELVWWDRLMQSEKPWLWSRRYSLERADIVSVVHLGRMARVVGRAATVGLATALPLASKLAKVMVALDQTIEERRANRLFIKRGVAFVLDGSNTAWNIQSGSIEGLAALTSHASIDDMTWLAAITMVRDFVATEIAPSKPDIWQYCAGPCFDGWKTEDNISVNTPVWEGNKTRTSTAHVSYRSMDARAVLETMATWKLDGLDWFPAYINGLVERGWLYPMTMAPLAKHGVRPRLGAAAIAGFGRSAIPFDLHNQVWALDAIASKPGMCDVP